MHTAYIHIIFLFYGLAFFSMGLTVALEWQRAADARLRHALRPLAAFGLIHGIHEWIEMFTGLQLLPGQDVAPVGWESLRVAILAFSFLSLGAFGASLLAPDVRLRRLSLLLPLGQAATWGIGLLVLHGRYAAEESLWDVADVWTRYVLAVPAALLAAAGLVAQQRVFRQAGMVRFGRDSLWAAVAFAWYGLVGQMLPRPSPLPPSDLLNQVLFLQVFGFPVQVVRAMAALAAAIFVIRFLRSFEVETQRQIADLQTAQLRAAQQREALRTELLRRVVAAQEAERQRVARELHDETGQALTALGLGLRGVANRLPQAVDQATHDLRQLERLAVRSLDELQRLIADLRPSQLDDLGLPAALRWYAKELSHRNVLEVDVAIQGDECEIDAVIKTTLFRVAQEALTNVIKHADVASASLRLRYGDAAVSLRIEDQGRGFDPALLRDAHYDTWGLLGMEERASLLGGRLRLTSHPGAGTLVEVSIPYQKAKASDEDQVAVSG